MELAAFRRCGRAMPPRARPEAPLQLPGKAAFPTLNVALGALNEALKSLNVAFNGFNVTFNGFNLPPKPWGETFNAFSRRPKA